MTSRYADLDRPPLDVATLRRALVRPGSLWTGVQVEEQVASTNRLLADRAGTGSANGLVLIAEHQTAGRGRLDRTWTAPPRSGITMSVLLRPSGVPAVRWPLVPLLSGLAVAATLRQVASVDAGLKWPNDVVVGERKVAGLLVEQVAPTAGPAAVVIGLGLNVTLTEPELPTPQATSLLLEGATTLDRSVLVRALLRTLEGLWTSWQREAGDPGNGLLRAYRQASRTIGRRVRLNLPAGEEVEGEAVGVDDAGRLRLRIGSTERAFAAGDVVHLTSAT